MVARALGKCRECDMLVRSGYEGRIDETGNAAHYRCDKGKVIKNDVNPALCARLDEFGRD